MKIKMCTHFSGPTIQAAPGDEIDLPELEALRMIRKGYASPLSPLPVVETAVPKPVVETRAEAPAEAPPKPAPKPRRKAARKGR